MRRRRSFSHPGHFKIVKMHGGVSVILHQLKRVSTADWKWQTWGILLMQYISGTIVFWHASVGLVKMSDSCERNNSGNQWCALQKKKKGKKIKTKMPAFIVSYLLFSTHSLQNNVRVHFFYTSSSWNILLFGSQLTKHQSSEWLFETSRMGLYWVWTSFLENICGNWTHVLKVQASKLYFSTHQQERISCTKAQ